MAWPRSGLQYRKTQHPRQSRPWLFDCGTGFPAAPRNPFAASDCSRRTGRLKSPTQTSKAEDRVSLEWTPGAGPSHRLRPIGRRKKSHGAAQRGLTPHSSPTGGSQYLHQGGRRQRRQISYPAQRGGIATRLAVLATRLPGAGSHWIRQQARCTSDCSSLRISKPCPWPVA